MFKTYLGLLFLKWALAHYDYGLTINTQFDQGFRWPLISFLSPIWFSRERKWFLRKTNQISKYWNRSCMVNVRRQRGRAHRYRLKLLFCADHLQRVANTSWHKVSSILHRTIKKFDFSLYVLYFERLYTCKLDPVFQGFKITKEFG